jgi:hypothetical protein
LTIPAFACEGREGRDWLHLNVIPLRVSWKNQKVVPEVFRCPSEYGTSRQEVDSMEQRADSLDPLDADFPMPKDKPVHEVRLGAIKAAIWKNDTQNGVRYNTTFSRLYRDEDEWKNTDSFGRDDLLILGKVADQAHSWIHAQAQSQEEREENGKRSPNK